MERRDLTRASAGPREEGKLVRDRSRGKQGRSKKKERSKDGDGSTKATAQIAHTSSKKPSASSDVDSVDSAHGS